MLTDNVVIFGGSYDPPHIGHVAIVMWMIDALDAKNIVVAPTYSHYFGKDLSDFNHRVEMCKLAFNRYKDKVIISTVEKILPSPNLTYNLLNHYEEIYNDKLAVVIGADNLNQIHRWNMWDRVIEKAKIVAVGRPGFEIKDEYSFDAEIYPVGISTVSSTEVKNRISNNESLDGFVSKEVAEYIAEFKLYR